MIDPFLKWAGGKRWLANGRLPRHAAYDRYVEPFLGGAAVFFALQPNAATLSDINAELINLYLIVRDQPARLAKMLGIHQALHRAEYYYEVRAWKPECNVEAAARTLYLNRTCWNGLYRVNRQNEFNVPIGTKNTVIGHDEDFQAASEALKAADIYVCDFEKTINTTAPGDFLFVDPPYTVKHNMNGFIKYNENIFSWSDQIRLAACVERAIQRGVSVVVTNADHPSVLDLYDGVAEYAKIERSSVLAGSARGRGKTTEALFSANI